MKEVEQGAKWKCAPDQLAENLVVLKVDDWVDTEVFADNANGGWFSVKCIGDILTCSQVVGFVCEFAATNVVDFGDVSALSGDFASYVLDEFFNWGFTTLHIENDKSFVLSHSGVF